MTDWSRADRFSDRIVGLMNEERELPDFSPTQMLAGIMLGMCALVGATPKAIAPQELIDVMDAIQRCLGLMVDEPDGVRTTPST